MIKKKKAANLEKLAANNVNNRCYEDKQKTFEIQLIKVYNSLYKKPQTMWDTSKDSGVVRANVCRHIAKLREQGRIAIIKKRACTISGHKAGEYTTNPEFFPKSNQIKLFSDE